MQHVAHNSTSWLKANGPSRRLLHILSRQWEISLVPLTALFLQLHLGGVHAQGGHDGAQLLGGDAAVPVLVEHREHLLELRNLLLGQLLVSHAHIHHYTEADNYY